MVNGGGSGWGIGLGDRIELDLFEKRGNVDLLGKRGADYIEEAEQVPRPRPYLNLTIQGVAPYRRPTHVAGASGRRPLPRENGMHLGQQGRTAAVPFRIETEIGRVDQRLIQLFRTVLVSGDIVDRNAGETGIFPSCAVIDEKPDEFSAPGAAQVSIVSSRALNRDGRFEKISIRVEADTSELLIGCVINYFGYRLRTSARQIVKVIEIGREERFEPGALNSFLIAFLGYLGCRHRVSSIGCGEIAFHELQYC